MSQKIDWIDFTCTKCRRKLQRPAHTLQRSTLCYSCRHGYGPAESQRPAPSAEQERDASDLFRGIAQPESTPAPAPTFDSSSSDSGSSGGSFDSGGGSDIGSGSFDGGGGGGGGGGASGDY